MNVSKAISSNLYFFSETLNLSSNIILMCEWSLLDTYPIKVLPSQSVSQSVTRCIFQSFNIYLRILLYVFVRKRSLHNTKLLILLRASSFNFNSSKCQFCKKNLEFPKLAKAWPLSVWQHWGFGCIVFAPLPTRPLLVSATLRDSGDLAQVGTCDVERRSHVIQERRSHSACSAPDKELRCWCSHDEPATARGGTRGWMQEREGRGGPLPPWHGASYTLHLPLLRSFPPPPLHESASPR